MRELGGEVEREGGFAEAGVGGEEGEATEGEVVGPEPVEGLGGDAGEGEGGHGGLLSFSKFDVCLVFNITLTFGGCKGKIA